mgnify:CR=1 FL=1
MKKVFKFLLLILGLSFHKPLFPQDLTLTVGDKAPDLNFRKMGQMNGEKNVTWEDYQNQVVIIDFWATWCPPCIESIPHLNQLTEAFKDKPVTFLSITYEPEEMLTAFLKKHPLKTIVGSDNDFAMFKSYKAWGIPMVVIVNREGFIASIVHPTKLTTEVIETVLEGKIPDVTQAKGWPDPEGAEDYFRSLIKKEEK